jgi:hypothetical protein
MGNSQILQLYSQEANEDFRVDYNKQSDVVERQELANNC